MKPVFLLSVLIALLPLLLQAGTCGETETLFTTCRSTNSAVTDIENDPDGFVFFATRDSLSRFDGLQTTDFDRRKATALPYGINDLLILKDGTKFIAADYGLYSVKNLNSGSITKIDAVEALKITSLAYLEKSGLIFGTLPGIGIFSYSPADEKVTYYTKENAMLPVSKPEKLFVTEEGTLFCTAGMDILSFDEGEFRLLFSFGSKIRTAAGGPDNSVLVATDEALYTLKEGETTTTAGKENLPFREVTSLFTDPAGRVWIGTSNDGVFVIENEKIVSFNSKFTSRITGISKITVDRDGDIWFASKNGFCLARCSNVDKIVFKNQEITDIAIDGSGNIWAIGPKLGIAELDTFGSENYFKNNLTKAGPLAIFADSTNRIWTSYDEKGIFLLENDTFNPVESRFSSREGLYPAEPTIFFEDSHGTVWTNDMAASQSVYIFNSNGELSTASLPVKYARIAGFAEYDEKILAFTEKDGVFRYINGTFEPEQLNLEHTFITSVFMDSENRIWITTPSAQLFIIIDGSDEIELPLKINSAISTIYSIAEGSSGDFWLTTDKGFVKIEKKYIACFFASTCDTIPANSAGGASDLFNNDAAAGSLKLKPVSNGRMAMPTSAGLLLIDTNKTETAGVAPQIFLNYAIIDEHQEIALGENEEIRLSREPRSIEIYFSTPVFAAPENVIFEITLDEGNFTAFDRKILISEPSAGSHKLTVRAKLSGADPADFTEKSIRIEIERTGREARTLIKIGILLVILLLICILLWTRYSARRQRAEVQLLINENVHKLEVANNMLRTAIMRDPLTNLMNRRFLFEVEERKIVRLLESWQRGNQLIDKRHSGTSDKLYALLMLDIDHFKRVNDIYGHSAGDIVLKGIAQILVNSVRVDDIAIRWGGEEFLVLLENIPQKNALRVAQNIRKIIEKTPFITENGTQIWITVSVGISFLPFYKSRPMLVNFERALEIADAALYKSKETRDTATYVIPGKKIPENDEELQKMVSTPDYALIMEYYSYQKLLPDNSEEFEL